MFLECLQVGPLASNCYILADEKSKKAVIVDQWKSNEILKVINRENLM